MKKLFAALVPAFMLMVFAAGCGPGEYQDPGQTPGVEEEGVPPLPGEDDPAGETGDAGQ